MPFLAASSTPVELERSETRPLPFRLSISLGLWLKLIQQQGSLPRLLLLALRHAAGTPIPPD